MVGKVRKRPSISQCHGIHADRTVAVLGGGPSLPEDLERVPLDAVLISVNHHALRLVVPDYMVFMDKPSRVEEVPFTEATRPTPLYYRVSPHSNYTDFGLCAEEKWWDGGFSSALGVWLACHLGTGKVLLAGMDLYQGPAPYFYRTQAVPSCARSSVADHLRAWRPMGVHCHRPGRIEALSGPLRTAILA